MSRLRSRCPGVQVARSDIRMFDVRTLDWRRETGGETSLVSESLNLLLHPYIPKSPRTYCAEGTKKPRTKYPALSALPATDINKHGGGAELSCASRGLFYTQTLRLSAATASTVISYHACISNSSFQTGKQCPHLAAQQQLLTLLTSNQKDRLNY